MRSLSLIGAAALGIGLAAAGCSDDAGTPSPAGSTPDLLPPPKPGEGVQLKMVSTLAAATETERCMFYQVPPEGMYVHSQEIRYTPGSHHVLVYMTPYKEIPTRTRGGQAVDTGGIFECGKGGPTANWEVNGVLGGAQKGDAPPIVGELPSDTAIVVPGGSVLMMNTHYLNASTRELQTDARINFYLVPREQVKQEAGILFLYNPFIHIPGNSRSRARMTCPVRKDITLVNGQSHMHRRGVDYAAYLTDATGNRLDELYTTHEWEEVIPRRFQPGKTLQAGQWIDYQCGYDNKEDRTVIQGLATTDEMCMFIGLYYPRDEQTEFCADDQMGDKQFLAARWIGNGSADGAATADCLSKAMDPSMRGTGAFYGCVVDSCDKISGPMTEATRCLVTSGQECQEACKGDGAGCGACLRQACTSPMSDLSAATCN
jgi:hypothetical protein